MRENGTVHWRRLWAVCLIAAMGGLLFGYDFVVIGGAKPFYEVYFDLTNSFQIGWAISSALVGCLVGSVVSGLMTDRYGRKRLLIFSGFLFTLSAVGTALSADFAAFVSFRILGGVGIGLASNLSPLYIAEISPALIRGKMVSVNQLTIVIGILLAQLVNYLIAKPVPPDATSVSILNSWNSQYGWRWMFAAETVPAMAFFLMMFFVPKSPRWLMKNNQSDHARKVLESIHSPEHVDYELNEIKLALSKEMHSSFRELLNPKILYIISIGVVLAVFQQWSGINVIFYYAQEIFSAAGYGVSDILLNIVITGSVNLAFTFVAIYTVDRFGRRMLMLVGSLGLMVIYFFVGLSFFFQSQGIHVLTLVVLAIACFAMSLGPVTWVLLAELFPTKIRGAAMSISVFSLWAGCFLLTYTFPILNSNLGTAWTFWLYSVICLFGFFYVKRVVPETKQKSLEEIQLALLGDENES